MTRIFSTSILIALFFCGCGFTTTELRRFKGSINASVEGGTFQRVDGPNNLLELFQFTYPGFFFPTASAGHSLFIEVPIDILRPERTIKIPDKSIKTFYYHDYHHTGSIHKELSGTIKIIIIADEYILADINLRVDGTDVEFNRRCKFKNADVSQYNQIER